MSVLELGAGAGLGRMSVCSRAVPGLHSTNSCSFLWLSAVISWQAVKEFESAAGSAPELQEARLVLLVALHGRGCATPGAREHLGCSPALGSAPGLALCFCSTAPSHTRGHSTFFTTLKFLL